MKPFLVSLFYPSSCVLKSEHLWRACIVSKTIRKPLAIVAVASFLSSLAILALHRFIHFQTAIHLIAVTMSLFVIASMLAGRFGRLCDAEKNLKYKNTIKRLCSLSPDCEAYYHGVKRSGRPFTRVDLEHLGRIYLQR